MRELFPGQYRPTEAQLDKLWNKGVFVFDTNVLLESYVLPEKAREELLAVLEKVNDRVWIPYQVALEFHRRRFTKIKDARKHVAELRKLVKALPSELINGIEAMDFDKWNTGVTDLRGTLEQLTAVYSKLDTALETAERKLPLISLDDPIAENISKIFAQRVGAPPESQKDLDVLYAEGARRYELKIPPGFSDQKKGDTYHDRGLVYEAKYADLILWRQLLAHVKSTGLEHIIFVTADVKEDWWHSEKSGERLGPQPALIEEFLRETDANDFWVYTPDQFLEHARKRLAVSVDDETVLQVKQSALDAAPTHVDSLHSELNFEYAYDELSSFRSASLSFVEWRCLREWVQQQHPSASLSAGLGIDIAVMEDGQIVDAYQVINTRHIPIIGPKLAAIPHFPGVRHHAIVALEGAAAATFVFGGREQLYDQLRNVMQSCGLLSITFVDFSNDKLLVLGELHLRLP